MLTQNKVNHIFNCDAEFGLKFLENNSVNLTVCSPPYGYGDNGLRDYTGSDWNKHKFEKIADLLYNKTKEGCIVCWVINDNYINGGRSLESFEQALYFKSIGYTMHDIIIWRKPNFSNPSKTRYQQVYEFIYILSKGKPKTFNPIFDRKNVTAGKSNFGSNTVRQKDGSQKERAKKISREFGMRHNVWDIKTSGQENPCKKQLHPATFSLQLAKDLITSFSNKGDIVLDPFCGSGTTLKAAKELERQYIGFEISEEYYNLFKDTI